MKVEVKLPELGMGIHSATLNFWYLDEGDMVTQGDDLVELTTDRMTFNLPSPSTGRIKKIYVNEGETIQVGTTLAIIEEK